MMIYKSPQMNEEIRYTYSFEGECVIVLFGEDGIDHFDFSGFKTDGEVRVETIETILPINPIVSAKRIDGTLYVEVIHFIDNSSSEEDRFPEWKEVG